MERKFKVGERVKVKSLDWYNANKDKSGVIRFFGEMPFMEGMKKYLNKEYFITTVNDIGYELNIGYDEWIFAEESLLSVDVVNDDKEQYTIIIEVDNKTFVSKQERNPINLVKRILTGREKWAYFTLEDNSTIYFGQDLLKKLIIKIIKEC